MKKRFNQILVGLCITLSTHVSNAQSEALTPVIGKPVPAFELKNLGNYPEKIMTSKDFKGRHVILDFWNKACVSCVQSFPKLNQVHKLYGDKLNLILVGTDEKGIDEMFAGIKAKQDLKFAYAFNRPLYNSFVTGGAPHLVWIDDKGIVKAVSGGGDLTIKNIEAFLKGESFTFRDISHKSVAEQAVKDYDPLSPFLEGGNGENEYKPLFRSVIAEYIPGQPKQDWLDKNIFSPKPPLGKSDGIRSFYETCNSLKEIYHFAYTGWWQWGYGDSVYTKVYPRIILELKDTSAFVTNAKLQKGLYWYSLVMPSKKANASYIMKSMQHDLERYFGYNARIETRTFPCLKLIATEKVAALKTKGGPQAGDADYTMFNVTNVSSATLFNYVLAFQGYWETGGKVPVIIDETGITYNLDVNVKVNITSWPDIQRALNDLGFKLVPAKKKFKVLVVKDGNSD